MPEKRVVFAPVLIPNRADTDGDSVTPEEVENYAEEFMSTYRNIDYEHTLNNVAVPVASYITEEDKVIKSLNGREVQVPAGSWIMGVKIQDEKTWQEIKAGKLTGFSVMAVRKSVLSVAAKSKDFDWTKDAVVKKTTMKDLRESGTDLAVVFVSVVSEPAVPDAVFFSLKSTEDKVIKDEGWFTRLKAALKNALTSDSGKVEEPTIEGGEVEMNEEQLKALLGEMLQPVLDRITALEEGAKPSEEVAEVEEEEVVKSEGDNPTEKAEKEAEEVPAADTNDVKSLAEKLDAVLQALQSNATAKSRTNTQSQVLKSTDGEKKAVVEDDGRDAYGRSKRK